MSTLTLYEFGPSRSMRVRWLLAELGVEYNSESPDLRSADGRAAFARINPAVRVPTVVLPDGTTLSESYAICCHLADRHPEVGLIPAAGSLARAKHDQWGLFTLTELDATLWFAEKHRWRYPPAKRVPSCIETCREEWQGMATIAERHLADHNYLVEERFQVADIFLGQVLVWARDRGWLTVDYPHLRRYVERLEARAAFPHHVFNT